MNSYKVGFLFFLIIAIAIFGVGCFNSSDSNNLKMLNVQKEALADVRFEINDLQISSQIRAAGDPTVVFQLQLLDATSSSNPIILIKKQATVSAVTGGYQAEATFSNVPALPALAKVIITGGSIVRTADSAKYSTWVGQTTLVANTTNTVTLDGEGSKSAIDVANNLLEKLISSPSNVATLASPIITKVNEVVAGLNLTSATVYDDALSAYNQLYGSNPPADAEFSLPTGFTSVAYPKKDATTNLAISNFASTSKVYLAFLNRSSGSLTSSWSVARASSNVKASKAAFKSEVLQPTLEQQFHVKLREQGKLLPRSEVTGLSARANLRAVAVNDPIAFTAYIDHDGDPYTTEIKATVNTTCQRAVNISGTSKTAYFCLDVDDTGITSIQTIIDGLVAAWPSIYTTNRQVFGAEPEGTVNGTVNANDFYFLISRKIYTAGYFYGGDLYPSGTPEADYSNEKKMFYLQAPTETVTDVQYEIDTMASTMAHEFQHMIHFQQNQNDEAWLDEAMSGYAEYINNYKIENGKNQSKALQVNQFFDSINSTSLTSWAGNHAAYGQVYLFGVWLAQNYGSNGSVQNLLSQSATGATAVAAFTGQPFDTVFAKFMMALAVNDTAGGVYGFKGLDLKGTYSFWAGLSDVTLTGPRMTNVDFTGTTSGNLTVSSYAGAYILLSNGSGTTLNVTSTLPTGMSLFQLKKN
ncbi:MAG: hypothetical protein Kow0029_13560 [Candidatus Rifleibacteriota bacterium]